jgi:hypothetical protein
VHRQHRTAIRRFSAAAAIVPMFVLAACGRFGFGSSADPTSYDASDASVDARVRAPLTFVQSHAAVSSATPVSEFATTFDAPTKRGDLLVAAFAYDSSVGTTVLGSVTDSQGNAFAVAGQPLDEPGFGQYLEYALAGSAASDSIIVTLTDLDATYLELQVLEYSGNSSTDPLDFEATQTMVTSGAGPVSTAPLETSDVDEQIVAYIVGHPGTVASGSDFMERTLVVGDLVEDQLAATPGSYPVNLVEDTFGTWTAESAVFH